VKGRVIIAGLALMLAAPAGAAAQAVPVFDNGAWVLPAQGEGNAAVPAEGSGTGQSYEDMIYETCATQGCHVSPEEMIRVMGCESGGDMGAVAYNPESGNSTYGIFQIDGMWGGGGMSAQEQIDFAAEHLGNDIFWSCL
jgi:hypothetical protein